MTKVGAMTRLEIFITSQVMLLIGLLEDNGAIKIMAVLCWLFFSIMWVLVSYKENG